jgi:hypothetical protein
LRRLLEISKARHFVEVAGFLRHGTLPVALAGARVYPIGRVDAMKFGFGGGEAADCSAALCESDPGKGSGDLDERRFNSRAAFAFADLCEGFGVVAIDCADRAPASVSYGEDHSRAARSEVSFRAR